MLTSIPLTTLETGGTEQQTQAVIDLLQARGWRVFWGIGTRTYCSESERLAFEADLRQVVSEVREQGATPASSDAASSSNFEGAWPMRSDTNFEGVYPTGHCPSPPRDGGTAGEAVAAKFRV